MRSKRLPFSLLVPILALIACSVAILYPALRLYDHLRTAPVVNGNIYIGIGVYQAIVPRGHLLSWSFQMSTLARSSTIQAANLPGYILFALVAPSANSSFWRNSGGMFYLLREAAYFVFCIPAWWFLGFGIEGLLSFRKLRWRSMLAGTLLVLFFALLAIAIQLNFGESPQDHSEAVVPLWGFFFWAAAFAIPPLAWLKQRLIRKPQDT